MSATAAPARAGSSPLLNWRAGLTRLNRLVPSSGATREIAAVDGLRALAILLVVWSHLYAQASTHAWPVGPVALQNVARLGTSGVELFFVISGFLLFLPYARALLAGTPFPSTKRFYYRRVLRILPLYYFSLATLLLFQHPDLLQRGYARSLVLTVLLVPDMTSSSSFYLALLNIVLWTLAVEWQFYLVLPWLARLIRAVAGRSDRSRFGWRLVAAISLLIGWGLAVRIAANLYYAWSGMAPVDAPHGIGVVFAIVYGASGKFLETFALGMGLGLVYVAAGERRHLMPTWRAVFGLAAVTLAVVGWAGCVIWSAYAANTGATQGTVASSSLLWNMLGEWVLGVCFALLVFAVLLGPHGLSGLFSVAPLRYIGVISYSIYIWHYTIIKSLGAIMPAGSHTGYISLALKAGAVIILYCSASYFFVERPFLSLRRAAHSPSEVQLTFQAAPVPADVSVST